MLIHPDGGVVTDLEWDETGRTISLSHNGDVFRYTHRHQDAWRRAVVDDATHVYGALAREAGGLPGTRRSETPTATVSIQARDMTLRATALATYCACTRGIRGPGRRTPSVRFSLFFGILARYVVDGRRRPFPRWGHTPGLPLR
jgi:hypothetical protein